MTRAPAGKKGTAPRLPIKGPEKGAWIILITQRNWAYVRKIKKKLPLTGEGDQPSDPRHASQRHRRWVSQMRDTRINKTDRLAYIGNGKGAPKKTNRPRLENTPHPLAICTLDRLAEPVQIWRRRSSNAPGGRRKERVGDVGPVGKQGQSRRTFAA